MAVKQIPKRPTWSNDEIARLKRLVKNNTPTNFISLLMNRSSASVRAKASRLKISLKEKKKA